MSMSLPRILHRKNQRKLKMRAVTLLTFLAVGFAYGDQMSILSHEEIKRYFSAENELEAPKYSIVYVEHVNSKRGLRYVTAEAITEASPEFKFQFEDEEVHITLKQDDSFLAPELKAIRVLTDDGEYWEPIQRDCLYRGYVTKDGFRKSSAQISTCSGMMGAIYRDDDGPLYIEPMTDEDASKRDIGQGLAHIVYRRRQEKEGHEFCITKEPGDNEAKTGMRYPTVPPKDDDPNDLYRQNTRAAKHLDMYVVGDKALYEKRGSKTGLCITAMMNSVTNGISWLGDLTASMKGVTLISGSNNLVPTIDAGVYLDRVIDWAKTQSGQGDWDVVALMTGLDISDNVQGISYRLGACNINYRGSVSEMRDWSVVDTQIHETGHNLGCRHDSDQNSCSSSGYLMAVYVNCYWCEPGWSSCSKSYYNKNIGSFGCM